MRERLPTLPFDLSEYARIHTGPASWSATGDHVLDDLPPESLDDLLESIVAGPMVGVCANDVPRLAVSVLDPTESRLSAAEWDVLALIDGRSDVEDLLAHSDVTHGDILDALCDLCARGMVRIGG